MSIIYHNETSTRVIFHFNKAHLSDPTIPMWVLKSKGETFYVNHVDVSTGVGFKTKETPDNPHTKGSIQIKGKLKVISDGDEINATIY